MSTTTPTTSVKSVFPLGFPKFLALRLGANPPAVYPFNGTEGAEYAIDMMRGGWRPAQDGDTLILTFQPGCESA